jgi:hypothetical protein
MAFFCTIARQEESGTQRILPRFCGIAIT